jgi:hypothetical protein
MTQADQPTPPFLQNDRVEYLSNEGYPIPKGSIGRVNRIIWHPIEKEFRVAVEFDMGSLGDISASSLRKV